jgi:hypothetical protein
MVHHPIHPSPPLPSWGGFGIHLGLSAQGGPFSAPCPQERGGMMGMDGRLCHGTSGLRMFLPWTLLLGSLSTLFLPLGPFLLASAVHPSWACLLGSSWFSLVHQGIPYRKKPRPIAAFTIGQEAQIVCLSRHLFPCLDRLFPALSLLLAPVSLPHESTGSVQEPYGLPRGLSWRAMLLHLRRRGITCDPGLSKRVYHRLQTEHPRQIETRSVPSQHRMLGCLTGASGGMASPPRSACLASWPEHGDRGLQAVHAGLVRLGTVVQTAHTWVKDTAPMRLRCISRRY